MQREQGFYWVKVNTLDDWEAIYFRDPVGWLYMSSILTMEAEYIKDSDIDVIGPRAVPPPNRERLITYESEVRKGRRFVDGKGDIKAAIEISYDVYGVPRLYWGDEYHEKHGYNLNINTRLIWIEE